MKHCGYCGRDNEDEAAHCQGCGTAFEGLIRHLDVAPCGKELPRQSKLFKVVALFCGLAAASLLLPSLLSSSPGSGIALSFSGYSTNSAGVRVALFSLVSSNQQAMLYRAMSVPTWTSLLGAGRLPPLSPDRFVQYGRLPPSSRMQLEVPVPAGIPADQHYRLTFAYCQDRGRFVEQTHRFWRNWVLRWVPHTPEPFSPPGFGSVTVVSPEVVP